MNASKILVPIRRRFSGEKAAEPVVAIGLALAYGLLAASAVWPNLPLAALFMLAVYGVEVQLERRTAYLSKALRQVGLSASLRAVIRESALLVVLARDGRLSSGWLAAVVAGLVLAHVLRVAHSSLAILVTERRRLPVLTRGFNLSRLRIPPPPPAFVRRHRDLLHMDVPVMAGALIAAAAGSVWPAAAGLAVLAGTGLGTLAVTARHARANRHLGDRDHVLKVVAEEVAAYGPETVLYFSGADDCTYQVNMWLETFDALPQRKMIILRERGILSLLGRTSSPILCFPGGSEMMNFPMPETTRVALFPANAGKNIHMLRLPDIACVFIGHGDSDKAASFSPFSKVYDEVWVAGPAGRERYLRSDAGVRDDEIVEVGRPQLAPIDASGRTPDPMFTVLYAPTWEGWTGDKYHTSVASMGPKIIRALLDHAPNVRVLYKPHPMAGKNDPAVRRAHRKIVAMIEKANAARDTGGAWADEAKNGAAARTAAAQRLTTLTERLAALGVNDAYERDEAEASRAAAEPDLAGDAVWRDTLTEAEHAYWEAEGWWRHRVVTGTLPHLYRCFNRADLLITDVSSVVADFIASGKPYVVTNGANLPEEEFLRLNPSASAAYLLGRDCAGLPGILAAVTAEGPDPMADRRRELRLHLLGGDDAMTRFAKAVDALAEKRRREVMGV